MAIYLGSAGCVELKRTSVNRDFSGMLNPDDVNTDVNRFSFNFPKGSLITGDRLVIKTQDQSDLVLIDDAIDADSRTAFARVNALGAISLYETFADAINDEGRLELEQHSDNQAIDVEVKDINFNPIAQITNFEITTSRDTVDITCLNDDFKRQYANGLIAGQGSLTCYWDYKHATCDIDATKELAQYFCQLVLRVQLGSSFIGRFVLHKGEGDDDVWYEGQAVVTNTSLAFNPSEPVSCEIQYVFTEELELKVGELPDDLITEDGKYISQENDEGLLQTG